MKDLAYQTLKTYMYPLSAIYGNKVRICDLLRNLIEFHFPQIQIIWDPTCGRDNYQFAPFLKKTENGWIYANKYRYYASDILKTPWNCLNDECLIIDVLKPPWNLPFKPDLVVYDPPFIPSKVESKRNNAYALNEERTLADIKEYYSSRVFEAFAQVVQVGLIVKGMDFYVPKLSDNLHLFLVDVLDLSSIRKWFKVVSLYIYRYFAREAFLHRARASRALRSRGFYRNIINHTYYLVLKIKK